MAETTLQRGADRKPPVNVAFQEIELPLTVRDAAHFLGVSTQTVYLWVERTQPHHPLMGRNVRFLKSDLKLFRATFCQEVRHALAQSMPWAPLVAVRLLYL